MGLIPAMHVEEITRMLADEAAEDELADEEGGDTVSP